MDNEIFKYRMKKLTLVLLVAIILLMTYILFSSKYYLETTRYEITDKKINKKFTVVQLTDLHNSVFGNKNSELIKKVKALEPNAIFITGDLVNIKSSSDTKIATDLIESLSKIAPVYFSYGNQEKDLEEKYGIDIADLFSNAGALVLEKNYVDTKINSQEVRIGGIYGYCRPLKYAVNTEWEEESDFLRDFQNTSLYTMLLCHMPLCWMKSYSLYDYNIDVVFSGHLHGGQVRIPFIGGLYAPDMGLFPGKVWGIFCTNEKDWNENREEQLNDKNSNVDISYYRNMQEYSPNYLILSRGLGNTDWLPRFNNIPEIIVVDFVPEE